MKLLLAVAVLVAAPRPVMAQDGAMPNPVVLVIVLGALALAPFILMMLTAFIKISVVLSILRNALGTQQVPPNPVVTGLAFILSIFVMVPVARQMYDSAGAIPNTRDMFSEASVKTLYDASQRGKEPLRKFLSRHSHAQDRVLFMEMAARLDRQNGQQTPVVDKEDFHVLIPSFATSQLKEAFQIGFIVFVPFLVIDMVVANVLLSMGMSMLSPVVISLPFKLLLFVLVDGWYLVVRGLVLSYA
ncbi:MAG TPA: type III secretion system export apparatus subunit SctR [Bryobacteraceae bacterium]|nr:type III secretion system export apparatus subunit SctR [Bryobacteraceae bacterium]